METEIRWAWVDPVKGNQKTKFYNLTKTNMKNSTKILIGVVVVALVGAGLYFGNTQLQKGSFQKIKQNVKNVCKSTPTIFYTNKTTGEDVKNADYTNFNDFYNYLKNELSTLKGNVLCPYVIELSEPQGIGAGIETSSITCGSAEFVVDTSDSGNKAISCYKHLGTPSNTATPLSVNIYYNKGNPGAYTSTNFVDFKQSLYFSNITVKKY